MKYILFKRATAHMAEKNRRKRKMAYHPKMHELLLKERKNTNPVITGQCPTICLEIQSTSNQLKSVFLCLHEDKIPIPYFLEGIIHSRKGQTSSL